jgi:hypothetical protein
MAGKWRQDNPFEEVEIEVNPFSVGISLLDRHADLIYLQLKQLCISRSACEFAVPIHSYASNSFFVFLFP